jgi:hypothetical protein
MKQPAKKFNWKNAGPYKVKKVVFFYAYRLKLPNTVKIHPIFCMSVLRPTAFILDALLRQIQDPPPLVKVDGKDEYFIKRINNIKYNKRKRQYIYFIKWRDYTKPLWESIDFIGLIQAAEDFYELYLELP